MERQQLSSEMATKLKTASKPMFSSRFLELGSDRRVSQSNIAPEFDVQHLRENRS